MPQIEVTFDIDANGILNVSAKDKGTGKEQQDHASRPPAGLSKDEIEKMKRDAEAHAAEDKKRRELVEPASNQADQAVYQVEKLLKEHGDKLSDADARRSRRRATRSRTSKGEDEPRS